MGRTKNNHSARRFAEVAHAPCVYAAELSGGVVKVGATSSARSRLMSLANEVRRGLGVEIGRFAVSMKGTTKAAYEAEARLVLRVAQIASSLPGRREFFVGISFDALSLLLQEESLAASPTSPHNSKLHRQQHANNRSGFRGVYFDKRRGRFVAQVQAFNKKLTIGRYLTAEEANEACVAKRVELFGQPA